MLTPRGAVCPARARTRVWVLRCVQMSSRSSDRIDVHISTETLEAVGFAKAMKALQKEGDKK